MAIGGIKAAVFDAYGTLFDWASAADRARDVLGDRAGPLAELWRAEAAAHAGLAPLLDAVLSVEEVGVYKPHRSAYQLAATRLGLWPGEILFASANGWDAWGAKASGLRVAWCNRGGQPRERLTEPPDAEVRSLSEVPGLMGI